MTAPIVLLRRLGMASLALALTLQSGCLGPPGSTVEEQRANALKMRDETLAELYTREPGIEPEVKKALGYATMSGGSLHLGMISLATAYLVVVDNSTGKPVHDCLFRFGLGPGLAVKSYRAVILLNDKDVMQKVVDSPWLFGILVEASFRFGSFGGSVGDAYAWGTGTHTYYWTKNGFALEAAALLAKDWHDGDLTDEPKK